MKNFFCICGFLFITNILLYGQTGGNTTLVGRWAAGPPYAFTVENNIVYTASGGILLILDITNPSEPQLLGQVSTDGIISDVAKSGNYVYLAEQDSGLKIIDVSGLADPVQVSELLLPGSVNKVIADNQTLFIAEGGYNGSQWTGGLRTLDISDPQNPQLLGFYDLPKESHYISLVDDYIYIDNSFVEFFIINVSDLNNPILVDTVNTRFGNSYLSGDFLFVASSYYEGEGLKIFNVSNPSSPSLVSQTIISGGAKDVIVNGNYAFLTNSDFSVPGRVLSFDVSDPNSPIELGFYDSPGNVASLSLNDNTLIINEGVYSSSSTSEEGCGLRFLDVTLPSTPQPIGFYATPGWGESVVVRDNYAFVLTRFGGMSIVDLQNISDPVQIGYYNSPGSPEQVALQNNVAYLADGWRGFRVIDISDLTNPVEVGSFETGDFFYKIDISGNYAYILFGSGMHIFDISNPLDIFEISYTDILFVPVSILVRGDYAYVGDWASSHWGGQGHLWIFDISDPFNPIQIGEYDEGYIVWQETFNPTDLALKDNYLYVADRIGYMDVLDVSDPTIPVIASKTSTFAENIEIEGDFAYLTHFNGGVKIFNILDPLNPQEIDTYNPRFYITDIDVKNGRIYASAFDYGMMILQNEITTDIEEEIEIVPEEFTLRQNYPNPFNPSTRISYSLPSAGFVSLKVYDVLGNEIATLVNENKLAGNYEADFIGGNLASGVYLYVLRYENQIYSKKMMLLK